MDLKEQYPFLERVKPYPLIFSHHQAVAKEFSWRTAEYFLKGVIYYPLRYFYDPTYTFPRHLFQEFYRRWKNSHWDVDEIVDTFKRRNRRRLHKHDVYVLGHIHERYIEEKEGRVIIHPDTWRDEYILDKRTKRLTRKIKSYVLVQVFKNSEISWKIIDVPPTQTQLNFNDVITNQQAALRRAAKEERFALTI
jgi:hypothetical protein